MVAVIKRIKISTKFMVNHQPSGGFKESREMLHITMDADLQDSPEEIPALYQMIMNR